MLDKYVSTLFALQFKGEFDPDLQYHTGDVIIDDDITKVYIDGTWEQFGTLGVEDSTDDHIESNQPKIIVPKTCSQCGAPTNIYRTTCEYCGVRYY